MSDEIEGVDVFTEANLCPGVDECMAREWRAVANARAAMQRDAEPARRHEGSQDWQRALVSRERG